MNNILLLHIGKPKTGTKAIQTFLYKNTAKLKEYGWNYPDLKKEIPEVDSFITVKEKNGDIFYDKEHRVKVSGTDWDSIWNHLLELLKYTNVIISAEEFSMSDTEKFLSAAKEKYSNIQVVIYLRRQDREAEAWYNQFVKDEPYYVKTFQEFLDSGELGENLHYIVQLDHISKIIGEKNLFVRIYERQLFSKLKYGLLEDFLSVMGLKLDDTWKNDHSVANLSVYGNYIEINRVFNLLRQMGYISQQRRNFYDTVFFELSQLFGNTGGEKGHFTSEGRKKFLEQYASENEQVAKKYFRRNDGILFYDNMTEYGLIHNCDLFEEDLIRFFSATIEKVFEETVVVNEAMMQRISNLEKENSMLAAKLLTLKKNNRNCLLFGGGYYGKWILENVNLPVDMVVDNNEKKNGEVIWKDIKITYAESIMNWSDYFVIVTCVNTDEIEKQLMGKGLQKEKDYVLAKEYFGYGD